MKIYLVEAEHPYVPGRIVEAYTTRNGAEVAALNHAALIVADLDEGQRPNFDVTADKLDVFNDHLAVTLYPDEVSYVTITEVDVQGARVESPHADVVATLGEARDALNAVMRCARGELERPCTQRQPWPEAQRLIERALESVARLAL